MYGRDHGVLLLGSVVVEEYNNDDGVVDTKHESFLFVTFQKSNVIG